MSNNYLSFLPVGGCNEIGLNANLYTYKKKETYVSILVDMGISFVGKDIPGCDIYLPDINLICSFPVEAIFITHIHEDHIGAFHYFWDKISCPVYGTPLACYLLKDRLKLGGKSYKNLYSIQYEKKIQCGPFAVEYLPISHSTPESSALFIETDKGNIFHTGDWKIDRSAYIGNKFLDNTFKRVARKKVLAVISDSTNVFEKNQRNTEKGVRKNIYKIISSKKERIFITMFASNIERLASCYEISKALGKDVCILGFSIGRLYKLARKSNVIKNEWDFLSVSDAKKKKSNIVFLCTGSQGEINASLSKLSTGSYKGFKLQRGDVIIFSSRIIPSNFVSVFSLYSKLITRGVQIYESSEYDIHVSGHPSQEELKFLYNIIKPQIVIPVHGTPFHTQKHAAFAKEECGVKYSCSVPDGHMILLTQRGPVICEKYQSHRFVFDGNQITRSDSKDIQDRIALSENGCLFVVCCVYSDNNEICVQRCNIHSHGLAFCNTKLDELKECVIKRFARYPNKKSYRNDIRFFILKFVKQNLNKSPIIEIHWEMRNAKK